MSLATNVAGVAVSATVAAITGSAAVLALAIQAGSDGVAQAVQLATGRRYRRSEPSAAPSHPRSNHREQFFWPFAVGLVLLATGGLFLAVHGGLRLTDRPLLSVPALAVGCVVAVAMWKSAALARSLAAVAKDARSSPNWWAYLLSGPRPELAVLVRQDALATVGHLVGAIGVAVWVLADVPTADSIAALAVGGVMMLAAAFHTVQMRSSVGGGSATGTTHEGVAAAIEIEPSVVRLVHLETYKLGPDEFLVAAKVQLIDGLDLGEVADVTGRLEAGIRRAVPAAQVIYLEPDVCRTRLPADLDPPPDRRFAPEAGLGPPDPGASTEPLQHT